MIFELGKVKKKFKFIDDRVLQHNLALNLQYISYILTFNRLLELSDKHLWVTNLKAVVLFQASIAESILHYCLSKKIKENQINISDILRTKVRYKNLKILAKLDDDSEVIGAVRSKRPFDFKASMKFKTLIELSYKIQLVDRETYNKLLQIMKLRNRIHLKALKEKDEIYTPSDLALTSLLNS